MPMHTTRDGVRLHVEIAGNENAPTVVLVHGLAASVAYCLVLPVAVPRARLRRSLCLWACGVFAGLALVLATIGLYGLLAYTTLKRVREIGIRLALGARPAQIRALILSHGMQLLLIGSVIGLVAAFALSRALQSVLFDVKGIDPRIYLGVGLLLFGATLLASWIPARRASRVDPIIALRTE